MLHFLPKKILRHKVSSDNGFKWLVLVSATLTPVTRTKEEAVEANRTIEAPRTIEIAETSKNKTKNKQYSESLLQVLCIRYPITFQKKFVSVLAFFDLVSKINAIYPTFA